MDTTKMSRKGRVTIPKAVRSRMAVRAGDRVAFEFDDDMQIRPLRSAQEPLRGFLAQHAGSRPDGNDGIRQVWRAKYERSMTEDQLVPVCEAAEEENSFKSAVMTSMKNLEADRGLSLAEVKARLLNKDKRGLASD